MAVVRRHALDALLVLAAVAGLVAVVLRLDPARTPATPTWFAAPAIVLLVLPLFARRRFPFAAPLAVWAIAAVLSSVDGRLIPSVPSALFAGLAAAFLLGGLSDVRAGRIGMAVALLGAAVIVANDPLHDPGDFVFTPAQFLIAWFAGFALHQWAAQAQAAEERAAHAERERESAARVAVAEERARIARELHDIVAHSVSVMVLQVGAVRHRLAAVAAEEVEALRSVEGVGRSALTEMRRLLGAMRSDDQGPELAPQPGLDELDALAQEVGRAGLPVRVHRSGEEVPVPRAVDLSAYRIVQEGLTNALKHARASHAEVTVRTSAGALHLEVRDDGRGVAPTGGLGHGLVGVQERVKIFGGEMTASPDPAGGFVLTARLPLEAGRP